MFKKSYRLNTSLFKEVFNFGNTIKNNYFLIKIKKNELKHSRFSIVVSKKVAKKAHERNYLKRKVFHALKEIYKEMPVFDYIFILNSQTKDLQYKDLIKKLKEIQF
ncbi:MAG: Ribonuclease [Candidatus Parcubacteria bacterium]|jgi:ribonuclease P protein component